jgi:hypothetical protein
MWRAIKAEEIKRGVPVRMFGVLDDGPYSMGTIIDTSNTTSIGEKIALVRPGIHTMVRIARPIAYASEMSDSVPPLMALDIMEVTVAKLLELGLVWEDSDTGRVRMYTVR